jgi:putative addiction module killer protein
LITIQEYLDCRGRSIFANWFQKLNASAAAKITAALVRIEQGIFSNAKSLGGGICEYRIDFGPGYRIYFGKDGETLIILLGGGIKKRQNDDILAAHNHWNEYKRRKTEEK